MDNYSKCLWIVEQLYNHGDMSFATLADHWKASSLYDDRALSNSTFRRRLTEISGRMNVQIVYDASRRVYSIENAEEIRNNAVYQYLLGAFHISSLTTLAQKHRDKVQLQPSPTGVELLHTILEAIDRGKSLIFKYKSYYTSPDVVYNYEIIPYFVRLFEGRWYLIAQYLDKSQVRVLALERASDMQIGDTDRTGDKHINTIEYYQNCFGVVCDDKRAQIVKIKVFEPQNRYIDALPLHESQKTMEQGDGYTIFEYFLKPSFDFTQELLWNGEKIEVLTPVEYRDDIHQKLKTMLANYE